MKEEVEKTIVCDELMKRVFNDSCDTSSAVWEKSVNGEYYNRVYTLQYVSGKGGSIIWYKIVIPCDDTKTKPRKNTFYHLYDLTCTYKTIIFSNLNDLEKKLIKLRDKPRFGPLLNNLSKFSENPLEQLNSSLQEKGQTWISVLNVDFKPKWKVIPCKHFNVDFKIFLSAQIEFNLNISKGEDDLWIFRYSNDSFNIKKAVENLDNIAEDVASFIIDNIKLQ